MNKTIRKEIQHYDVWLQWNLTSQCNFGCTYCFGKTPPNKKTINRINIDAVMTTLEKDGRTFRIGFTGGEPFLIPNFTDACKKITDKHYISLNTNLVISEKIGEFCDTISPVKVLNVHASLHFEELIRNSLFDRYAANYYLLKEAGFNIYSEAIAYPETISQIKQYRAFMKNYNIEFRYAPFFGEHGNGSYPEAYSDEELSAFELDMDNIKAHYQKGNKCNAGFTAAVVSPTGKISPCFNLSGNLGHIEKGISLNERPMICPASKCVCPLNYYDEYLFLKSDYGVNLQARF